MCISCKKLLPLATTGDGNCLLHAASLGELLEMSMQEKVSSRVQRSNCVLKSQLLASVAQCEDSWSSSGAVSFRDFICNVIYFDN